LTNLPGPGPGRFVKNGDEKLVVLNDNGEQSVSEKG
jgi:hypothetical protein